MYAARDQAGNVRHIEDVECAHLVGNLAHAREIPQARVSAGAADDDLRLFLLGNLFHLVVIDGLGVAAHVIKRGAIELAAEAQSMTVREVTAVRKIEAENGVTRRENSRVGRSVGLRAGVRLHVDVLAAEELAGAIAGQILHDVGILAAAVVTASRIALGIFIGEDRAGCLQHRFGDEVFARYHLQSLVLAEGFVINGGGYIGIGLGKGQRHAVSHR